MSELTSDDNEDTTNLASATVIFSSCTLLFGLKRRHSARVQGYLQSRKYEIDSRGV